MKKTIVKPRHAPTAVGPYSQAVRVGDLLFCSGQIPLDPETGQMVTRDIKTQTERVLKNLRAILTDQGLSMENVVKTTVYLTDMADFEAMNAVYAQYFGTSAPARATVQVAALPRGARIEIDAIAHY